MIKKVEYDLNYRIKGKKITKKIEIDFVPYQRHVDYGILQKKINEVQLKWNRLKSIETEIQILTLEKPVEYIKNIKELQKEIISLSDEIQTLSNSGIVEKRYELLKEVLIDNGYSDDADLMSWEFWKNSVEVISINELLEMAINKDIDKKKIIH